MERDILIGTRERMGIGGDALFELYRASFDLWRKNGLETGWLHHTQESLKLQLSQKTVFVAVDKHSGELLGMHALMPNRKAKALYGSFLAVSPTAQHCGVATRLLQHEADLGRQKGFTHMLGSTATSAVWSLKWHLKNGYRIIGYSRSENDNYASYHFRLQLAPSIIWSGPLAPITARLSYLFYRGANAVLKDADGRPTRLLKHIKKWRARNCK